MLILTKNNIYRVYFCQNSPLYTMNPQYIEEFTVVLPTYKNLFMAVGNHSNDSYCTLEPFRSQGIVSSSYRLNGKPYKALDPIPVRTVNFQLLEI
jgi:hypothetical protein